MPDLASLLTPANVDDAQLFDDHECADFDAFSRWRLSILVGKLESTVRSAARPILQTLLAPYQRLLPKITAVEYQKVERPQVDRRWPRLRPVRQVQPGEVRVPVDVGTSCIKGSISCQS
jgi:hypothetical protein